MYFTIWVPIVVTVSITVFFFVAHMIAILKLTKLNEDYWNIHKDDPPKPDVDKECYECNAWISRFIISLFLQPGVAIALILYMFRYQKERPGYIGYESVEEGARPQNDV